MQKIQRIIINCIIFLFMIDLYETVQSLYPMVIFETKSFISSTTVFGLLFWIVYSLLLITVFEYNQQIFSAKLYEEVIPRNKKNIAIKLLLLFIIQVLYDLAISYFDTISFNWKYICFDILSYIHWIVVYIVVVGAKDKIIKKTKTCIIISVAIAVIIIASIGIDVFASVLYNSLIEKYQDGSPVLVQSVSSLDYLIRLKMFLVDCLIVCLSIIYRYSGVEFTSERKKSSVAVIQNVIGGIVIWALCITLNSIVASVFPQNIHTYEVSSGAREEDYHVGGNLNIVEKDMAVLHENSNTQVFSFNRIWLYRDNVKKTVFYSNDCEPNLVLGNFLGSKNYAMCPVENEYVCVYWNDALSYYENGKYKLVKFSDLNDTPQQDKITGVCKLLIEEGNLFVFEYGYEYLMKYASDFIEPYILRYSQGDFTDREIEWLEKSYYNESYIVNIAKSIEF